MRLIEWKIWQIIYRISSWNYFTDDNLLQHSLFFSSESWIWKKTIFFYLSWNIYRVQNHICVPRANQSLPLVPTRSCSIQFMLQHESSSMFLTRSCWQSPTPKHSHARIQTLSLPHPTGWLAHKRNNLQRFIQTACPEIKSRRWWGEEWAQRDWTTSRK